MDANLITALAGVLGSVTGASAAIATTWISQKSQTIRERAKWETRKRETLCGKGGENASLAWHILPFQGSGKRTYPGTPCLRDLTKCAAFSPEF